MTVNSRVLVQQEVNAPNAKSLTVIKIINVAVVSSVQMRTRQSFQLWEWIHASLIAEMLLQMLDLGIGNSATMPARYRNAMIILIVMMGMLATVLKPVI
jgi:hypothetical protein